MKYIDLSRKIDHGIPVYPGDMEVSLIQEKNIEMDKYTAYSFSAGLHAGTHIDSPMHMLKGERTMEKYPLACFAGRGCLIDARGEIDIDYKTEYDNKVCQGDIVLLFTGTEQFYGTKDYYQKHPVITEKLAHFLVSREIKILGVDMPSPDYPPFAVHKHLLSNNIFILENLANLKQLLDVEQFEVFAMPLKICAEASPTRAFARCR